MNVKHAAGLVLVMVATQAHGQTRFVGDSPTRPQLGRAPIGTSAASSSGVSGSVAATRSVVGYRGFGYRGFRYGALGYGGIGYRGIGYGGLSYGAIGYTPYVYRPDYYYTPGLCRGCGFVLSGCRCGGPVYGVYVPPLYLDNSDLFGPRALLRFYGLEGAFAPPNRQAGRPPAPRNPAPPANPPAGLLPAGPRVAAKPAGGGPRARAWRFIDHGDRHFKAGRFREALSRYKKAASSDANLAAAKFRAAFAYLGLENVDLAALSIRRGLAIDPNWPEADFVLEDLLDDAAQQAALKTVAKRLQLFPNNSEARLVAGVLLQFDGQPDGAAKQFRRAIAIAGEDPAAALFLAEPEPAAEQPVAKQPGG
ncbi:MAG: hypothetical protein AAF589_02995 [Planctomycetota bacterium]